MFTAVPEGLARALTAACGATPPAVHYAETIGSTNDAAAALAEAGAPAGTVVVADQQTAGRGRLGRSWSSPPGAGIYLSYLARGARLVAAPGPVTLGAGTATADAVRAATGLTPGLKWPNDLVVGAAWRKLGGILTEAHGEAVIVGVGLNVTPAAHPADVQQRATDLESELGRAIDRDALTAAVVAGLRDVLARVEAGRTAEVIERWRACAAPGWAGAAVRWADGEGIARDVDADGALIVEREGRRERVVAGEVAWRHLR